MKLMKRTGIYKAANVTFDPKSLNAYSYDWWRFVAFVEGLVVFNNYRYSVSTAKHQSKVRSVMRELGIKIDIEMPLPRGIRADQTLAEMIVEAEETSCDEMIHQFALQIGRNERAAKRRLEARVKADAEFKANLDSISFADIVEFRAAKAVSHE